MLGYFKIAGPTLVYQDNTAAISLSSGGVSHKRSKHFGLEFDALREYIQLGEMKIKYKPTDELAADLLTKALGPAKFIIFRDLMMGSERVQNYFINDVRVGGSEVRWGPVFTRL